jgi:hypothetical protein
MADIAGISGSTAFDPARAGGFPGSQQTPQADTQETQNNASQQQIEDQVTIDSESFANAGNDFGGTEQNAGGQNGLEANINDTSAPNTAGGTAAFDSNIGAESGTEAPGTEDSSAPTGGTSNTQLATDARSTNQLETTETQQAGNDNESQTEGNRTLGQVIDVFA